MDLLSERSVRGKFQALLSKKDGSYSHSRQHSLGHPIPTPHPPDLSNWPVQNLKVPPPPPTPHPTPFLPSFYICSLLLAFSLPCLRNFLLFRPLFRKRDICNGFWTGGSLVSIQTTRYPKQGRGLYVKLGYVRHRSYGQAKGKVCIRLLNYVSECELVCVVTTSHTNRVRGGTRDCTTQDTGTR